MIHCISKNVLQLLLVRFRLCLTVLKYKGEQVNKQREEIEMLGNFPIPLSRRAASSAMTARMLANFSF